MKDLSEEKARAPWTEEELFESFRNYCDENHPEFDPEFRDEIKRIRPEWLDDL